ncbi:mannosyltransferase KTR3 NDAI_0C05420 [Naumovozyma dairenensis CBS 421]|uniref:Glycosyltransferase family 15 protein n=1 Tax=Naumovozyma dairenensis (strain ATCC 10597 / BCRC 20456 / CBS 421 / NBRC 0211 / NRRL Y-12639) TaxID=1071378 RepID=G0W8U0_NAUDC|nr:hypothetical protein NDAI_0C05420 [Naumovozyma dairenensis CBS 421]CCD24201.1 hypothetical protein NDAI_0C05420 [Naumovozyma dairenensis CBS 421]
MDEKLAGQGGLNESFEVIDGENERLKQEQAQLIESSSDSMVDESDDESKNGVPRTGHPSSNKNDMSVKVLLSSLIMLFTGLFIVYTNPGHGKGRPIVRLPSRESEDYIIPFTDKSQNVFHPEDDGILERAAMVTLSRNSDLYDLLSAIHDVESHFNNRYHYDWVFLNDKPFSEEFKRLTTALVSGNTKYGLIDEEQWSIPPWIDRNKFEKERRAMEENGVPYGDSEVYRHMCRYQSGFIWRHPLVDEYDYYWRVDTDIKIYCDIQYDIFKFMRVNNKKYGFILSLEEYQETIPTFWQTVTNFTKEYEHHVNENNLLDFVSDDGGKTFNGCHFWTNFEIASLKFYRSQAYRDYFDYLDHSGGFYYERWGDAPVHSIGAALLLDKSEVHFFDGLGFYHPDFHSCPVEEDIRVQNKCICNPAYDNTWWKEYFCTRKFFKAQDYEIPEQVKKSKSKP